jgi:hypothetical protein
MTLFVVAFFVIATLVLLLWLLVRPLADEASAVREEAAPSIFGVEDRARRSHNVADADAPAFVAEKRGHRVREGIGRSLES